MSEILDTEVQIEDDGGYWYDEPGIPSRAWRKYRKKLPPDYEESNKPSERWFRMEKPR